MWYLAGGCGLTLAALVAVLLLLMFGARGAAIIQAVGKEDLNDVYNRWYSGKLKQRFSKQQIFGGLLVIGMFISGLVLMVIGVFL